MLFENGFNRVLFLNSTRELECMAWEFNYVALQLNAGSLDLMELACLIKAWPLGQNDIPRYEEQKGNWIEEGSHFSKHESRGPFLQA